jgi:hypothetical protein
MAIMITHHRVKDYAAWRPIYDGDAARRRSAGIRDWRVAHSPSDPNDIYMIWEVEDPSAVQRMVNDPGLKEQMEKAGVISPPEAFLVLEEGK